MHEHTELDGIAIIGMVGRFPDAAGAAPLWDNLCAGRESVTAFTDEKLLASGVAPALLRSPNYVKAGVVLDGVELFDANFFGYTPREAELTDPQHRIFLECAWEALEDAGYDPDRTAARIGVFAGTGTNTYFRNNILSNPHFLASLNHLQQSIAIENDYLATRVSYKLNLKGPSFTIQSACSTSLVATHVACQSLLNGECDMALAGGAFIKVPQVAGYLHQEGSQQSSDGHCRAFDASAKGMISGSGAGVVVLKRLTDALRDGDCIRAVIRGSAINNDGAEKIGFTAPSVEGQAAVIAEAQAMAGVNADEITYVEAHGTGTKLGDPIEIAALTKAFRRTTQMNDFCAIGSLKTNIGHLGAAAGVAGLIKVALALENRQLPLSLNFMQPNPAIDFKNSPFHVQQILEPWQPAHGRRVAGVSSFGIGGTNAHAILEEAPPVETAPAMRSWQVLPISAKSPAALEKATSLLAEHLATHPAVDLADVAFTLQQGRKPFAQRRIMAASSIAEAAELLKTQPLDRVFTASQDSFDCPLAFMFPGQAAQYVNMGAEIYRTEKRYRDVVDFCCEFLKPHLGFDLRQVLNPSPGRFVDASEQLNQTAITQPAMFVVEYALATLWMGWGVRPDAMIGHSIGEYVAACLAGVFSLQDALTLVASRGRLMQTMPTGSMLAVRLDEHALRSHLSDDLCVAVVNGSSACVASGPTHAIQELQASLIAKGIESRLLSTSHAFHSNMMEPILDSFRNLFRNVKLNPAKIPFLSNVTGSWITAAQATDPGYWSSQLRQPVRFADGLGVLLKSPRRIILEVGPGHTLNSLARQHPARTSDQLVLSSFSRTKEASAEMSEVMTSLGRLWTAGVSIDWPATWAGEKRLRVPLPTYPFERKRYWIEPNKSALDALRLEEVSPATPGNIGDAEERPGLVGEMARLDIPETPSTTSAQLTDLQKTLSDVWRETLGFEKIGIHEDFFALGGDSLLAVQLMFRLRQVFPGEPFPLQALFEAPTVAGLANWIQGQKKNRFEYLVQIKPGAPAHAPFFCVHASDGNPLGMQPLASALDADVPFYGLLHKGLDGSTPFESVEEAARSFLHEVRQVQPHGPYYLAGYCFGGIVAFEMARMLEELGESVAALFLIDGYNPAFRKFEPTRDLLLRLARFYLRRAAMHSRKMLQLRPGEWISYARGRLKALYTRMRHLLKVIAEPEYHQLPVDAYQVDSDAAPTEMDLEEILDRARQAGPIAARKFVPSPYHGSAVVIRASERRDDPYEDPFLGWKPLVHGRIESFEIEAGHKSIFYDPVLVLPMAEIIDAKLRESSAPLGETAHASLHAEVC